MSSDKIPEHLEKLKKNSRAIERDLIDICFYMRGGINIEQAYQLTATQRDLVSNRIKQNIELTEKTKTNFL